MRGELGEVLRARRAGRSSRPPDMLASPMFGIAASGARPPIAWSAASAGAGPAPWFVPIAATPSAREPIGRRRLRRRRRSSRRPRRRSSSRRSAGSRRERTASIAVDQLVEVEERLDHEQVDAATGEERAPARRRAEPRSSGHVSSRSPSGPIEPAMKTSLPETCARVAGELHARLVDPRRARPRGSARRACGGSRRRCSSRSARRRR